jgi:CubicO group peptidase (beta-lactamase class C family)
MNHRGGIKNNPEGIEQKKYKNATAVIKALGAEKIFVCEKGEHHFSNIGYVMLGYIIEKAVKEKTGQ